MHLNSCSALISFVPCEIIVTHLLGSSWTLHDIIHVKYFAACLVHAKCSDNVSSSSCSRTWPTGLIQPVLSTGNRAADPARTGRHEPSGLQQAFSRCFPLTLPSVACSPGHFLPTRGPGTDNRSTTSSLGLWQPGGACIPLVQSLSVFGLQGSALSLPVLPEVGQIIRRWEEEALGSSLAQGYPTSLSDPSLTL